ncbi:hypothetical protein [Sphingomonas sp. 3-13AW]|uniref:hypothetical protein n=1 Tax=Sphingomonas sp. 3-13AW TaxID=3050450 RepID=UPI003BB78D14
MNPGVVAAIAALALVGGVICYFLFGIIFKLLWGWWPVVVSFAVGGWAIWSLGFEYIWMLSLPILGSIVGSWLWQRTSLFLSIDAHLERMFLMGE